MKTGITLLLTACIALAGCDQKKDSSSKTVKSGSTAKTPPETNPSSSSPTLPTLNGSDALKYISAHKWSMGGRVCAPNKGEQSLWHTYNLVDGQILFLDGNKFQTDATHSNFKYNIDFNENGSITYLRTIRNVSDSSAVVSEEYEVITLMDKGKIRRSSKYYELKDMTEAGPVNLQDNEDRYDLTRDAVVDELCE